MISHNNLKTSSLLCHLPNSKNTRCVVTQVTLHGHLRRTIRKRSNHKRSICSKFTVSSSAYYSHVNNRPFKSKLEAIICISYSFTNTSFALIFIITYLDIKLVTLEVFYPEADTDESAAVI